MNTERFRGFDDRALRVLLARNPNGYFVTDDGRIVRIVRTPIADRVRGILMLAAAFVGMKAMVLASTGIEDYEERRAAFAAQGGAASNALAVAMGIDPVTRVVSEMIEFATN